MAEKMLKFASTILAEPPKRDARRRVLDFEEVAAPFPSELAAEQAARCAQCGVPFCQGGCPLANAVPDWLKLAAEGRLEEAYELAEATNPMPEICGRICPQDRLCEGACVIERAGHGAVTIGAVEKYIADTAWARGWVKPIRPMQERAQSVGIVGAGPAGLAAADGLRRLGYRVTVYDRADRAGGLLALGIPNFKLDKSVVQRRVARLAESGVVFRLKFEVGRDASLADLGTAHDALLLATGAGHSPMPELPGAHLAGVVPALEYLVAASRGGRLPAALDAKGRDTVVIGGDDTAMDALRTALRQGAKSVTCLYRRDHAGMPGSKREVVNAAEEGAEFRWLAQPKAFLGQTSVEAVAAVRTRLGLPDAAGRRVPEEIPGTDFTLPATLVVAALGLAAEDLLQKLSAPGLAADAGGLLAVSPAMMTGIDGVFAGGDAVRGASLAVWAIRDGREAAKAIHGYLQAMHSPAAERTK
jgi:glutamate synthase (NADPH) small chain